MPITWCTCPACGENKDIRRQGPALSISTKRKSGAAPAQKATVLTTSVCTMVRCGFCGTVFRSDGPTFYEAFGGSVDE
jgi:hypothetical protein